MIIFKTDALPQSLQRRHLLKVKLHAAMEVNRVPLQSLGEVHAVAAG